MANKRNGLDLKKTGGGIVELISEAQ